MILKNTRALADIRKRGALRSGSRAGAGAGSSGRGNFFKCFSWFTAFPQMCERPITKVPNERINVVLVRHKRSRVSDFSGERRKVEKVVVLVQEASVLMQRLSYPTETVNKITGNIIVLSFKDSPRKPLRRRPNMFCTTIL